MKTLRYLYLIGMLWIVGCAPGVAPESKNAEQTLAKATLLIETRQDPVSAERLVREAISSYQKSRNTPGLAEAYAAYGLFYQSEVVGEWHDHYERKGFADSGATYANRFQKSLEYYTRAAIIQKNLNHLGKLAELHQKTGTTYKLLNLPAMACNEYKKSVASYERLLRQNPEATLTTPPGFATYADYVASLSQQSGCPE